MPRSAQEYWLEMQQSGLTEVDVRVSSAAEAEQAMAELRQKQKQLRQVKREVNLEINRIRADYRERIPTAAQTSSAIMGLLAGQKAAGRMRADEKRRLTRTRDSLVAPYDHLRLKIDDMLVQIDGAKLQLDQFIDEAT